MRILQGQYEESGDSSEEDQLEKHFIRFHSGFYFQREYIIILELLDWTRPLTLIPPPAYYTPSLGTLYEQNPYKNLAKLGIQLLSALVEINEKGFVHCDIKPQNILYTDSHVGTRIKVIDFGNATAFEDLKTYHEDFEIQAPGYRAPEVLMGDYEMNEKIDVWSVGVVLLELLVNHVFRAFRNNWRLVSAESRLSTVVCITRYIGGVDVYRDRGTMYWTSNYATDSLVKNGLVTELGSMIMSLTKVLKTPQEVLALDFILSMVQIDHRERWSAKQALMHPFLTKSLQHVWAQVLTEAGQSKSKVPGDSFIKKLLG